MADILVALDSENPVLPDYVDVPADNLIGEIDAEHLPTATSSIPGITPLSTQAQAQAGTNNTTSMTPARVKDAMNALGNLAPGTTLTVTYPGSSWPARPTSRTDLIVQWVGGPATPRPAGALAGDIHMPDAE